MVAGIISFTILLRHTQTVQFKPLSRSKPQTLAHVFIIMDENKPFTNIVGNPSAPYINGLIKQYALATNYYAITHPSLPNYLALTSGSTDGITTDCNPPSAGCEVNVKNIADAIQNSGRTWKEYAESMPSDCYAFNTGEYSTDHNPFIYYSDIINNKTRCDSHVVTFTDLLTDLKTTKTTPNYAYITPNVCDDMHSCPISSGDSWLSQYVPVILNSPAFRTQKSLLVITFDEGSEATNHIPTIFVGSAVKKGYWSNAYFNDYSLLHTIEKEWDLPPLTNNDRQASLMTSFLK